jgi:nucleoid DNA-binding protein
MAKKKTAAKKSTAAAGKARTKSQILSDLSDATGLAKKEIASVFEEMTMLMKKDLSKKGPGVFTVPGLLKVKVISKPATKARKGINPFTGEETMFKAKPARRVVKAQPLKGLKDLV